MAPRKGGVRRAFLSLLLILPLIVGAAYVAGSGMGLSSAWIADGAEEGHAPGPVPGIDVAQVQEARRAIGEANTQAGFLNAGMGRATEGIGELKDGGTELVKGTGAIREGASELSTGLNELQVATGQLGGGASDIAGGAGAIADGIGLVNVAIGQVEATIGPAKESARAAGDQTAVENLEALERQLGAVDFDALAGEAERFRRGAEELSYQLNTPGAPYRDGIFSAAAGAGELRRATEELDEGAKKIDGGLKELDDGAPRLDGMAQTVVDKVSEASRAMPVPTGEQLAAAGLLDGEGDEAGANATLAPTLAFLVSALVMLAASALWLIATPGRSGRGGRSGRDGGDRDGAASRGVWSRVLPGGAFTGALAGIVAIGALVLFIMADGLDLLRGATSVIVLALAALAATALARAVLAVFGASWGRFVIVVGMLVQVGVIGWVWRTAASAATGGTEMATAWGVVAALLPLHHPTAALTALGNDGSTLMWGSSAGVLLALVVIGALVDRFGAGRRRATVTAPAATTKATTKAAKPKAAKSETTDDAGSESPVDDDAEAPDAEPADADDADDGADGGDESVVTQEKP
ncbi:hypothetical protein [Corynebacterium freneyi]|uniref:X-X-X-Leu-X-X-Gly heptad repeat-containing protein n=1 Tax=Corynebacterium freneyi DNF00450 TaxID=1287475 RepID=A0A095Y1P6_9CORY|nr:hypothetical protein [Corynebacterium freneyi]KGF16188.1 hypothetical protein HMPREF1650_08730 [Corynebacterium freneyi DNF00450]